MANPHTFAVGGVDVILAPVFFLHGDLLELVGDVVGSPTINVPVRVNAVGAVGSHNNLVLVLGGVLIFTVAVPVVLGYMPKLATDLAAGRIRTGPAGAAAAARLGVDGAAVARVGGAASVVVSS